tara:strand:+ start:60 stop:332 length:273 start_codon:yes stop_codon:yes gene_type:complete
MISATFRNKLLLKRSLSTEILPSPNSTFNLGTVIPIATLIGGICWKSGYIENKVQTLQEGQDRMEKKIEKIDNKLDRILIGNTFNTSPRK